jgi:hypothetical protein
MSKDVERRPGWLDKAKVRVKKSLGMKVILCDSCKWDWRGACHHTERPNAAWCPTTKTGRVVGRVTLGSES